MSDFEEKHVYTYHQQPLVWLRYIDDIFCIWQHGESSLESFIEHLNGAHRTIKFTAKTSDTRVNFLDTTVIVREKELITTLYVKPTDRNTYLPFNSAHPYHCKKGLPYGQFLRIRRICSQENDFETNCVKKSTLLLQKGYPMRLLHKAYVKAKSNSRDELLKPKTDGETAGKKERQSTFLTTTYAPNFNGFKRKVTQTWDLLDRASNTRRIHENGLVVGYRRTKNLRDLLVRAKLPECPIESCVDPPHLDKTCKNKNCRYCPILNRSGKITSHSTGQQYRTRHNVSCNSNNLTCCITCKCCNKHYVGHQKTA